MYAKVLSQTDIQNSYFIIMSKSASKQKKIQFYIYIYTFAIISPYQNSLNTKEILSLSSY